jgi:hypothetical protein
MRTGMNVGDTIIPTQLRKLAHVEARTRHQ